MLDARTRSDVWIVRALLAFIVVWGGINLAIRVAHPGLELGDGLNDADILHAANWFAQNGYRGTHFLPVRETAFHPDFWAPTYNTFPPGVFYLHQLQRAVGLSELWHFRVVSVLLSQAAVWLWFLLARRLTGSTLIGALAALLYMLGRPYVSFAGGFWEHMPMLTLFGTLLAWVRFEHAPTRRQRALWLAAATALNFLDNWLTLQHAVMIALIIGVRAVIHVVRSRDPARLLAAALVGVMPAVVGAMRFGMQVLHSGSVAGAIEYFRDPLRYRIGTDMTDLSIADVMYRWMLQLGWPGYWEGRWLGERIHLYPALTPVTLACAAVPLAILLWTWHAGGNRGMRKGLLNALLIFAGAMTWAIVMKQHAYAHVFPVLMYMPALALLIATLAAVCIRTAGERGGISVLLVLPAVGMALPLVYDLRRTDIFNRVVELDPVVRDRVLLMSERLAVLRTSGPALAGHTLRVSPRWPSFPYELGQPFYQTTLPMDTRWSDNHLAVLDINDPRMARMGASMSAAMGLPDFTREPARVVVLPGVVSARDPRTRSICTDRPVAPGAVVREARWARTIDGEAWVLAILIDGPLSPREASSIAVRATLLNERGERAADDAALVSSWGSRSVSGPLGAFQRSRMPGAIAWFFYAPSIGDAADRASIQILGGPEPIELELRLSPP